MEKIDIDGDTHRHYIKDAKLDFDEDELREFKKRLSFTKNQIPPEIEAANPKDSECCA